MLMYINRGLDLLVESRCEPISLLFFFGDFDVPDPQLIDFIPRKLRISFPIDQGLA